MKEFRLESMIKGWFVGDFEPVAFKTKACEVAVKHYKKGDSEQRHFHKIATELTLIVSGRVLMNDKEFKSGDIVLIEPGESTDFVVLEDTITAVVKLPSSKDDKFLGESK